MAAAYRSSNADNAIRHTHLLVLSQALLGLRELVAGRLGQRLVVVGGHHERMFGWWVTLSRCLEEYVLDKQSVGAR